MGIEELLNNIYQLSEHFNITNIEDCQILLYMIYNNQFKLNNESLEINNAINNILKTIEEQLLNAGLLQTDENNLPLQTYNDNNNNNNNNNCYCTNESFQGNFLQTFLPYSLLKLIENKERQYYQYRS